MKLIRMTPNPSGAYSNIQDGMTTIPEGCALVPESLDLSGFYACKGFIIPVFEEIEATKKAPGYSVMSSYEGDQTALRAWEQEHPAPDPLVSARAAKLAELSDACRAAIVAGMDVETTQGMEHFALEETDQINLTTALSAVQQGAEGYPYHADGALCRMFSSAEIEVVAAASIRHKLYHTTLCNHLMTWARRVETVEELSVVTYSADALPEDLAFNMAMILTAAGGGDADA